MNRKFGDSSRHIDNDKTQDIIKGIDSALEWKPDDKECAQNLDKMLAGKSLKELEAINDAILCKSSETLEGVYEYKESTSNDTACHNKSATQLVAKLERGSWSRNEGSTIKE